MPKYERGSMGTRSNCEPMDLGYLSNVENDQLLRKNPANVRVFGRGKNATASDFFLAVCAEISVITDCDEKKEGIKIS